MNVIESALSDALGHGKELAGLAGKLRDKLKGGVADMQAVYDEAEAFVDASVAKAREGLAAFKDKVAEIEGEVKGEEADMGAAFAPKPAEPATQPEAPVTPPAPETPVSEHPVVPAAVASVVADTGAPAEHVAPAVEAHADAVANGSTPEVAHADAQAAAANAGASPEVAVTIADSVATQPAPETETIV